MSLTTTTRHLETEMPEYVGVLDEADEFATTTPVKPVKNQGTQRTAARQAHLLKMLENSGRAGATAKDAVAYLKANFDPEDYHGPVSSALTALHKAGKISRLREQRSRFNVYVLPENVAGRETIAPVKSKEGQDMLGLKSRTVDTSAADAKIAELQHALDKANVARDRALTSAEEALALRGDVAARLEQVTDDKQAALVRLRDANATIERINDDRDSLSTRLDAALQRAETAESVRANAQRERDEAQNLLLDKNRTIERLQENVTDLETELATAPKPVRKTITAQEKAVLDSVAKALVKYPSDGTPDSPTRITVRVSTLRTLGRALSRLTSD
jgi:DNA repair ATPase RecN